MSKRTISINPQFFNMSKKKKKIIPSEVNINASNIRQLLLDKLKEHKKTRKIETNPTPIPLLQNKTFEESCKENDNDSKTSIDIPTTMTIVAKEYKSSESGEPEPLKELSNESGDKPYGNLKNGTKPTYKQYNEQIQPQITHSYQDVEYVEQSQKPVVVLEEKEVKKTFKLGKSGKTISILIKNNKTRKKVEDTKTEHKKTHLSTIKNYLKEKNLIKFGSSAPSKLLREMYETSELCGGILNQNKDILIHNFDK